MCLRTVDQKPKKLWGYGYKVVRKICCEGWDTMYGSVYFHGAPLYRLGDTVLGPPQQRYTSIGPKKYLTGFHIFTNFDDARKWATIHRIAVAICRVRYSKVKATGKNRESDKSITVVARKMILLEEL
jgi:hypothetical protein